MAFFVVSQRNSFKHSAWGSSYELEDIVADTVGAQVLAPQRYSLHRRVDSALGFLYEGRYRRLSDMPFESGDNQLLLITMGPGGLRMLNSLGPWRERCSSVAAYIIDLYPESLKRIDRRLVEKLDHLFISYEQMMEPVSSMLKVPVTFIPQACDVLGQGSSGGDRPIDLIGYGRQRQDVHCEMQKAFSHQDSQRLYFHSTFTHKEVDDWREDRQLFWQLLRRTKMSVNFPYHTTHPHLSQGVSPLTARWFEAITAGVALVGGRPSSPETERLFGWEDSIIDLPSDARDCPRFIEELAGDADRLQAISQRNYLNALQLHDWRYRIREMLGAMKVPSPERLNDEISQLEKTANGLEA